MTEPQQQTPTAPSSSLTSTQWRDKILSENPGTQIQVLMDPAAVDEFLIALNNTPRTTSWARSTATPPALP
jgi:hypothetical protein